LPSTASSVIYTVPPPGILNIDVYHCSLSEFHIKDGLSDNKMVHFGSLLSSEDLRYPRAAALSLVCNLQASHASGFPYFRLGFQDLKARTE